MLFLQLRKKKTGSGGSDPVSKLKLLLLAHVLALGLGARRLLGGLLALDLGLEDDGLLGLELFLLPVLLLGLLQDGRHLAVDEMIQDQADVVAHADAVAEDVCQTLETDDAAAAAHDETQLSREFLREDDVEAGLLADLCVVVADRDRAEHGADEQRGADARSFQTADLTFVDGDLGELAAQSEVAGAEAGRAVVQRVLENRSCRGVEDVVEQIHVAFSLR